MTFLQVHPIQVTYRLLLRQLLRLILAILLFILVFPLPLSSEAIYGSPSSQANSRAELAPEPGSQSTEEKSGPNLFSQGSLPTDSLFADVASSIVINEIHHSPFIQNERTEFIELYNTTSETVDISGWLLDGGVRYLFAANTLVPAEQTLVIAQDPARAASLWGIRALGPYEGRLNGDGEELLLRRPNADVADQVAYRLGFPWPTVGDVTNHSINLLHPLLDNGLAGNWRSAPISPGLPNPILVTNAPPHVEQVEHSPRQPTSNQGVQISAWIADPEGVTGVTVSYQIVEPGQYIEIGDPLYVTQWVTLPMQADGEPSEIGQRYIANLPASVQVHRRLVRYRIQAADGQGATVSVPFSDDPQPNFAYFVYDGVPAWQGAIRPKDFGSSLSQVQTFDFQTMRPLPVYHLISTKHDFTRALHNSGYEGSEYRWQGTFVYNGEVYDHIRYRARGGTWRYATGKTMAKFDFNRGHYFQAYNEYGEPYSVKWDKLNLGAIIQHGERLHRGEQGLFESVGFRLFNLAGVEAPKTHYIHFRAVVNANEHSDDPNDINSQYDTDFRGLYLVVEQMDGRFLQEHSLPDGNLYKMEPGIYDRNNQGANSVSDYSDIQAFVGTYLSKPSEAWWHANLDGDKYYSYRSIVESIHHYDIHEGKNYFYFHNPESNLWEVHPWDIDQTWAETMVGTGYDALARAGAIRWPALRTAYHNRFRELLDLLFNPEQVGHLLNEQAALVNTPNDGHAMVDADRAMWDYNPMMKENDSNFTVARKAGQGRYYESSPTGDFPGMVDLMKEWVVNRTGWIYNEILTFEFEIPVTPMIAYSGPPGYPADSLHFSHSGFVDPQGDAFAGLEWRVAPIYYPGVTGYDPMERNQYEIESSWQSGVLTDLSPTIQIPSGACLPGQTCRVRVRMLDGAGHWSHWSAPVEFVAGSPTQPAATTVIPTELMYNPIHAGPIVGTNLDFIELKNVGQNPIDLSQAYFADGIQYTFPQGQVLAPQEILVLAEQVEDFEWLYGFAADGQYQGNLSNNGESIHLVDPFGRTIFEFSYSDSSPWPFEADNQGYSAVLRYPSSPNADPRDVDLSDAANWRASTRLLGSPMSDDPVPIVINELLANPANGDEARIELWNPTRDIGNVEGWYLTDSLDEPQQFQIPSNTFIQAGDYWLIGSNQWSQNVDGSILSLSPKGGKLYLLSATPEGRLTGYKHEIQYGAAETGVTTGRHLYGTSQERFVVQKEATFGATNDTPLIGPLVFSKISYRPVRGAEFIEITNISTSTVALSTSDSESLSWKIEGVFYQFPQGISVPPGGRLLLVPTDPNSACISNTYREVLDGNGVTLSNNMVTGAVRILGPYGSSLGDSGGHLALYRPGWIDLSGQPVYIQVEEVNYQNGLPWPPLNNQSEDIILTRNAARYSDDPTNWHTEPLISAAALSEIPEVVVCSFDVFYDPEADATKVHWTLYSETAVKSFNIWQGANELAQSAIRLNQEPIPAQSWQSDEEAENPGTVEIPKDTEAIGDGDEGSEGHSMVSYTFSFAHGAEENSSSMLYWLEALGENDENVTVAYTSQRAQLWMVYLPLLR